VVCLVKFAWIRACVEVRLADDSITQIYRNAGEKKNGKRTLNAFLVLEDSGSLYL